MNERIIINYKMNWHYIKNITKKPRVIYPSNVMGTNKELIQFTNRTEELKGGAVTGRAWRASELRLKSTLFHKDLPHNKYSKYANFH